MLRTMLRTMLRPMLRITAAAAAVVVLGGIPSAPNAPIAAAEPLAVTPDRDEILWAYQNAFRNAVHRALPVVVKIDVVEVVRQTVQPMSNPFSFLFGRTPAEEPVEREFRRPGLGSGFIVRRNADMVYVLTNAHVVGDASEITVSLHDGRRFDASLLGRDDRRDLALLVFQTGEEVQVAVLGDSDGVQVGDWAFAVGNPLGFESTVTSGIISAVGRRPAPGSTISQLTDYIQTDASVNRGNSGGPLVNLAGEVIGINTWIASQTGGSIGLGFAIPINNAKQAIDEFISFGTVEDGWLGIRSGSALSSEVVASLGLPDDRGVLIAGTFAGSPAATSGILPGDVIRDVNGAVVRDFSDLLRVVSNLAAGRVVPIRLYRDGQEIVRRVEIAPRVEERVAQLVPWPGLMVMPLSNDIRNGLGLRNESGSIVVSSVDASSAAALAGLRRGDIIRRVNDTEVATLSAFYRVLNERVDRELVLRVYRQGRGELSIGLVR